jgi:hypothetical protein
VSEEPATAEKDAESRDGAGPGGPPDDEPHDGDGGPHNGDSGPVFSGYGVASAVLGVLCVAAVALSVVFWSAHRERTDSLSRQIRVAQAAVDWTGVLINMNKDNVDDSLRRLHDGTVGELNKDFDAAMQPYRDVVLALQARSNGQLNSVSIESVHHNLDAQPGAAPRSESPPELASRTDTVLIVATSVSEIAGNTGKPQTVRWNLRVGVSDVGGKLLISRLEPIR